MDYTLNIVSKCRFFFIFIHSRAPKRSWKIFHGVLESPGKVLDFLSVKEWEPWRGNDWHLVLECMARWKVFPVKILETGRHYTVLPDNYTKVSMLRSRCRRGVIWLMFVWCCNLGCSLEFFSLSRSRVWRRVWNLVVSHTDHVIYLRPRWLAVLWRPGFIPLTGTVCMQFALRLLVLHFCLLTSTDGQNVCVVCDFWFVNFSSP